MLATSIARYFYPSLGGLRRELDTYLRFYNHDRVHHGRLTKDASPHTSSTVPKRWTPDEPNLSTHPRVRPR